MIAISVGPPAKPDMDLAADLTNMELPNKNDCDCQSSYALQHTAAAQRGQGLSACNSPDHPSQVFVCLTWLLSGAVVDSAAAFMWR